MESIRRTICWDYLNRLHASLPQSYRSPKIWFSNRRVRPKPLLQTEPQFIRVVRLIASLGLAMITPTCVPSALAGESTGQGAV